MTSATTEPVKTRKPSKVKADRLILVNLSAQTCDAWLDVARKAGQPWHEEVVSDLDKAELLLKEQPQAHALVCYDAPEQQIANCIAKGRLPSQALANWLNFSEALLELYRGNFQRMTLVRREALEQNVKEFFSHLKSRTGIALGRVKIKPTVTKEVVEPQQDITYRLLAVQALQDPVAQRLGNEIEASTLPLCETGDVLDLVDDAYTVLQEELGKRLGFTGEDYALLLEEKERLASESKLLIEDKERLISENELIIDDKQRLASENELLIEQLHKVQSELEQYLIDEKKGEGKITRLQHEISRKNEKLHNFSQKNKRLAAQLQEVRQELKSLKNSKSWKITAPLRKMLKALGAGKGGKR